MYLTRSLRVVRTDLGLVDHVYASANGKPGASFSAFSL